MERPEIIKELERIHASAFSEAMRSDTVAEAIDAGNVTKACFELGQSNIMLYDVVDRLEGLIARIKEESE